MALAPYELAKACIILLSKAKLTVKIDLGHGKFGLIKIIDLCSWMDSIGLIKKMIIELMVTI